MSGDHERDVPGYDARSAAVRHRSPSLHCHPAGRPYAVHPPCGRTLSEATCLGYIQRLHEALAFREAADMVKDTAKKQPTQTGGEQMLLGIRENMAAIALDAQRDLQCASENDHMLKCLHHMANSHNHHWFRRQSKPAQGDRYWHLLRKVEITPLWKSCLV